MVLWILRCNNCKHININDYIHQMVLWMWSPYLVASVGLGFYLSRWPEVRTSRDHYQHNPHHHHHHHGNILHHQRLVGGCWTGCVDIYGHSHQIWHVLIFSGITCGDCDDDSQQ